ncbi:MAG: hypothetical protein AAFZ65_04305, partial [Planctomycetota bacterium]
VFARYYSSTDIDITAASYSDIGAPALSQFAIETTVGTFDVGPAIAFNWSTRNFAVAWQRSDTPASEPRIRVSNFRLSTGTVQNSIDLGFGRHPDIGSSWQYSNAEAMVVAQANDVVWAARVEVQSGGKPKKLSQEDVMLAPSFSNGYARVAISKTHSQYPHYLVAAEENYTPDRDLRLQLVDGLEGTADGPSATITTIGPDEERPDVAAHINAFVLVYEREQIVGDGDAGIYARKLVYDWSSPSGPGVILGSEVLVEDDLWDDEREPSVARSDSEWVVTWQDQFVGSDYDIFVKSIDFDNLAPAEPESIVSSGTGTRNVPELASTIDAGYETFTALNGEADARVAIAYNVVGAGAPDQVKFHLWNGQDAGTTYEIGGGSCTGAGSIGWGGSADMGSNEFWVTRSGADPSASLAWLNLANPGAATPCGACSILPLGLTYLVTPMGGFAQKYFSVPSNPGLQGAEVRFQWIVGPFSTFPCPSSYGFRFSDVLTLTLDY